jgi:hypothetical protein
MNKKVILLVLVMINLILAASAGSVCQEQTLFKQLDCLIGGLTNAVTSAGLEAALTNNLVTPLERAQRRKDEAETACQEGDQDKATNNMKFSRSRINTFKARVENNTGAGKKIPDSIGNDFLAQATEIQDIEQELLDTNVCDGAKCLPDPPLGAINCELDRLIALVNEAGLDPQLTQFLVSKLTRAKEQKETAEQLCVQDKAKKATGKLKAARARLKSFIAKVKAQSRGANALIPSAVATTFLQRAAVIDGYINELLENGVCS